MLSLQGIVVKMYIRYLFLYDGLVPVVACLCSDWSRVTTMVFFYIYFKTVVCDERRPYAQVV